jgi:hypothetical protein
MQCGRLQLVLREQVASEIMLGTGHVSQVGWDAGRRGQGPVFVNRV